VGARFSDTVNLDLEKDEWKEFTKAPYRYQNQFDAMPGTYKLTVVLSGGGDTFGKFESPLQIDSYDGKKFSLGGLALTSSATRISDIPTGLDSALLEDRTPLVVKGMQVVPSASNRFKRSDNLIFVHGDLRAVCLLPRRRRASGLPITFTNERRTRTCSSAGWRPRMTSFRKATRSFPAG